MLRPFFNLLAEFYESRCTSVMRHVSLSSILIRFKVHITQWPFVK